MKIRVFFILTLSFIVVGCAAGRQTASSPPSPEKAHVQGAYHSIKETLEQNSTLDYDTLLEIHQELNLHQPAGPQLGELLSMLIGKQNEHPRIDNMILILAADTIGNSQRLIENVYDLFDTMLKMDHRLNSWVLSFIGDAIGKYPFDIPGGDQLADLLEKKVAQHVLDSESPKEFFGYHFMPPPKGEYIPNYLSGIEDQQTRVLERNCYYSLIRSQWTEAQIETALRQLQRQGLPETDENSHRPLKYLIFHQDLLTP